MGEVEETEDGSFLASKCLLLAVHVMLLTHYGDTRSLAPPRTMFPEGQALLPGSSVRFGRLVACLIFLVLRYLRTVTVMGPSAI